MKVRLPEALITDDNGAVKGYVTEVNDAFGHQVFCYDQYGRLVRSFQAKEAKELGFKNSFDVAKWFSEELERTAKSLFKGWIEVFGYKNFYVVEAAKVEDVETQVVAYTLAAIGETAIGKTELDDPDTWSMEFEPLVFPRDFPGVGYIGTTAD